MLASDWNKLFKEERMANLNTVRPKTSGPPLIWRTVPGTNFTLQVSMCGRIRQTSRAIVMSRRPDFGTVEIVAPHNIDELVVKAFPLSKAAL